MKSSEESTKLNVEYGCTTAQAQRVLDLLAVSEDVYDIEAAHRVLAYALQHSIDPCGLASFICQLLARRIPARVEINSPPLRPESVKAIQRFLNALPDSWTPFIVPDDC